MSASGSASLGVKPFKEFGIEGSLPGSGDAYASVSVSADALASWNPAFGGSFGADCASAGRLGGIGVRAAVARGVAADLTGRAVAGASPPKRSSNDTEACEVCKDAIVVGQSNAKRSLNDKDGDLGSDQLPPDLTALETGPELRSACGAAFANGPTCANHT